MGEMTERTGDWMQTFTGRQFWPLDPRADEIEITDIAHALSMACRYAGHCTRFYSVAEHSVLLSRSVPQPFKLWALLHDAAEAYVVDVPRPLKPYLAGYREIEERVMSAVCERFGLDPTMPPVVKEADNRILVDERAQVMSPCAVDWNLADNTPLGVQVFGWSPAEAEAAFLAAFDALLKDEQQ